MSSPERQPLAHYTSVSSRESKDAFTNASAHPGASDPKEVLSRQFASLILLEIRYDWVLYLGRDRSSADDSPPILLKAARSDLALDSRTGRLFHLEADAAAKLKHPNIVESSPVQNIDGVNFIRIDHSPEGETLSQLLEREGWLDPERTVEIIRQLAHALEFAHDHHVLHLRIEPGNVLLDPNGTVTLRDFGIDSQNGLGWAHALRADWCPDHYISPEVAAQRPLDARSDLYSLGVLCYKMLTDRLPIDAEDPSRIRIRHLTHQPLLPHYYSSETPEALSEIILRMLEKDPAKRFQDARSLRIALDNALGSPSIRIIEEETSLEDELSDFDVPSVVEIEAGDEAKVQIDSIRKFEEPPIDREALESDDSFDLLDQPQTDLEIPEPLDWNETVATSRQDREALEPPTIEMTREPWEPPSITGIEPEVTPFKISQDRLPEIDWESDTSNPLPELSYYIDRLSFDPTVQSKHASRLSPVFLVMVLTFAVLGGIFVLARFERIENKELQNKPVKTTSEPPVESAARISSSNSPPDPPATNPTPGTSGSSDQSLSGSRPTNKGTRNASVLGSAQTGSVRPKESASFSKRSQRGSGTRKQWRRFSRRSGTFYFDR